MPIRIESASRVEAAGTPPKIIDEYVGRVNSGTDTVSIAHMRSPSGWSEPGQTPEFDEYTLVLAGMLRVEHADAPFFSRAAEGQVLRIPIKHGEGAYFVAPDELERMEANGQIAVRYCDENGEITDDANPNGALRNIAGVRNGRGNVFGLMPHPEHAVEPGIGGTDGISILGSLVDAVQAGGLSR